MDLKGGCVGRAVAINQDESKPIEPKRKPLLALGIDPGISGAIALVSGSNVISYLDLADTLPLNDPVTFEGRCGPKDNFSSASPLINGSYLNPEKLIAYLSKFSYWKNSIPVFKPDIIIVEDVSVQTGAESARSMFKFGQTKGLLSGILHTMFLEVPIKYVKPNVWKPALGLSSDKKRSLALARKTWKNQAEIFKRVKDADRAEAALLGLCGLKILNGG